MAGINTAIRRLVGRTSILPTEKGKPSLLAKKERHPTAAVTHRFAHAKNPLMSQRGVTPLDTPVCPVRHDRRRTDTDKQVCRT